MRVLLKFVLDCEPDAAWRALRDPAVFRAVSAPFSVFESLEPGGFPELWEPGEHPVAVTAFGVVPVGVQVVAVSFDRVGSGASEVRMLHDDGYGVSGALARVRGWHHTMAVSAAAGGGTLYRDQLRFEGPVVLWPVLWAFWQWRGLRLKAVVSQRKRART